MEEIDQPQVKPVRKKRTSKTKPIDVKPSAGLMMYTQGATIQMISQAMGVPLPTVEGWYKKYKWDTISREILKDKLTATKAPQTPSPSQTSPVVVDCFGKGLSVEVSNNRQEIYHRAGRYHEVIDLIREEMMLNPKKRNAVAIGTLVKAEQVIAQVRSQALGDYHEVPTTNVQHALAPITVIFPPIVSTPRQERIIEATVTEVQEPVVTKPKKKQLIPGIEV